MKRTAWLQIRLSPAELAALKAAAAEEDSDVSEFVRQALGQWLWRSEPFAVNRSAADVIPDSDAYERAIAVHFGGDDGADEPEAA